MSVSIIWSHIATGGHLLPTLLCSDGLVKMSGSFSLISNLTVTTHIFVSRLLDTGFFLGVIFESKQVPKSASGSKHNNKLTKWYVFLNGASQTCSQIKRRFTYIVEYAHNCSLEFVKLTLFLTNNLFKNPLAHNSVLLG